MQVIESEYATVYVAEIEPRQGQNHRQAEHAAVRAVLDECLGPDTVLSHHADGAPEIAGWHVSISHSRRKVAVALSRSHRVGIDAEEWRTALARVSARFLSQAELACFVTPEAVLTAWTIKEAVYKVIGPQAYEYAYAIAISPDMRSARVGEKNCVIATWRLDDTVISLAVLA